MINERMFELGDEPSAIRELFAYGMDGFSPEESQIRPKADL